MCRDAYTLLHAGPLYTSLDVGNPQRMGRVLQSARVHPLSPKVYRAALRAGA